MTDVISGISLPHLVRSPYDSMPDSADEHWQQNLIDQLPMITAQWVQHQQGPHLNGIHDFDMYAHDDSAYAHSQYSHPSLVSPNLSYSDMETVGTPSTSGFGEERTYSYPSNLLRPPHHRMSQGTHSPNSSHGGASPREQPLSSPQLSRPGMIPRSNTAPEPNDQQANPAGFTSPAIKHSSDEDEYVPSEPSNRGRKRQRIPHTAVERRYRENLNAHLDKLRQHVPALALRGADGMKGAGGQGVRPSKCEILNGAIEHIGALTKDVSTLR